jgi:hypothetical protein
VVQEKILKQISFWSRFRLTLPGRISIAKTFMISLLNYLGCVFQPDDNTLNNIQRVINHFVKKNLNISDTRLYLPQEHGGVGFFLYKGIFDCAALHVDSTCEKKLY